MKGHQMLAKLRKDHENEEGFTLIELLVVVIIIGILAAIAIPAFLNQRDRARQAQLTSSVRNAALDVEADATANNGTYPVLADGQATVDGFEDSTTLTYVVNAAGTDFCIVGVHTQITAAHHQDYQASTGGLNAFDPDSGPAAANTLCSLDT